MIRIPLWARFVLAALLLAAALVPAALGGFTAGEIGARLAGFGWWVPVFYLVLHVALTTMFVPRFVMGVAAGIVFGLWAGLAWSMVGAMAGAMLGFWLARLVKGDAFAVENLRRVGPLLERAEAGGWRSVMAARLVPVIPHPILNYALGITRLGAGDYALGSFLGMVPSGFVYANFGASGRYALGGGPGWIEPLAWGAALLALSFLLPKLMQRWIKP
jgi:uncharacterized membrane protein YdjX (TVP38/TMEM64 family)